MGLPYKGLRLLEGNAVQIQYLGSVSQKMRAVLDYPASNGVEILDLVGAKLLKAPAQSLDEAVLLLATEIV